MTARAGMVNLIARLRALCAAGTADTVVAGVTYWSDDQLQERLDRTGRRVVRVTLQPMPVYVDGTWRLYDYHIPVGPDIEEAGVDSGWAVRTTAGEAVSSGYTVNYLARRITFSADQEDALYTLDCRVYDVHMAAAQVWEEKAGFVAGRADWGSDNHHVKASQVYRHCMAQAAYFRDRSGARFAPFVRTDEA